MCLILLFSPLVRSGPDIWVYFIHLLSLSALLLYIILHLYFPPYSSESQPTLSFHLKKIFIPLAILLGAAYFSFLFSTDRVSSRNEIFNLLNYLFLFYLATTVVENKKRERLVHLILLIGIFFSVPGIFRLIGYDAKMEVVVDPKNLAGYLTMAIPSGIAFILSSRISDGREFIRVNFFNIVGFLLMVVCLSLTKSAGAIVGVVSGIFVVLYLNYEKKIFFKFQYIVIATVFLILLILLFQLNRSQVTNRFLSWGEALIMVYDRPLVGIGLGAFKTAYGRYRISEIDLPYVYNYFLHLSAEVGVIGVGAFLWFLWLVWRQIKVSRCLKLHPFEVGISGGIIAILLYNLVDANLSNPANGVLFWVFLGLLVGPQATQAAEKQERKWAPHRQRLLTTNKLLVTGVLTLSILGVGVGMVRLFIASWHYETGKKFLQIRSSQILDKGEMKNIGKAELEFRKALELDPTNPWYREGLSGIYLARYESEGSSSYLDEAIIELREGNRILGHYAPFFASLSRMHELRKDYDKAILNMASAIRWDRQNHSYRQRLMELARKLKEKTYSQDN